MKIEYYIYGYITLIEGELAKEISKSNLNIEICSKIYISTIKTNNGIIQMKNN